MTELLQAFHLFDQDGSGSISSDELYNIMEQLGIKISDEELKEIMEMIDTSGMFKFTLLIGAKLEDVKEHSET